MAEAGERTREALLEAAEALFSEHGYAAVGVRQIVERAGVNIAAINYHFGSKSALYLQAVQRAMRRRPTATAWNVLEGEPRTRAEAAAALARFIRLFMENLLVPPTPTGAAATCLILHEAAEPSEAIDEIVRHFIEPYESLLVEVIRVLAPAADRETLAAMAQSVLAQVLHYRTFRPFLERLDGLGSLGETRRVRRLAGHVSRFTLAGLGCQPGEIDAALVEAGREPAVTTSNGR